ncbi:MAG: glycosyltransferase family 2 protein [Granulosicoccus sp.]
MGSASSHPDTNSVSVVIPTHNRLDSVCLAIESVLVQEQAVHQIIVVDDGSTDGTSEHLKKNYPDVVLIEQSNHGVSHARNRAIERASGDWIALLDSDDRWYPDKIATQINALQKNAGIRLCHCDEHWIRNGKRVNPKQKHQKRGGEIFKHCLPLCVISPSASVIHRSIFDEIGLFDESLPACEDYDLWLRICSREPVLYVDKALLEKTGGHEDQLSRRYPAMDQYRLQALAGVIRSEKLSQEQLDLAKATFMSKLQIFCNGARKRGRSAAIDRMRVEYSDLVSYSSIL